MIGLHSKKEIGAIGEKIAARYLRRNGYRILARNLHLGRNELDLVAKNKHHLTFVEVKTRSFATPEEAEQHRPALAVDQAKRQRTLQAAREYLHLHPTGLCPRMDVIEVYLDRSVRPKILKINHIENAFSSSGRLR
jgi:putative endonuclease